MNVINLPQDFIEIIEYTFEEEGNQFKVQVKRRVDIIQERTGWEREKIIQWATAHAVLSAWWSIKDNMEDEFTLQCAKIFSELK